MWTSITNKWPASANAYEKFVVERFIQRGDYTETISNKQRTINGYTQLKEIIKFCELSFKRGRTVKTVIAIIEESQSKHIKQNICNDIIIEKYFSDLKDYISSYNTTKLLSSNSQPDLSELRHLMFKLKIFEIQLDENYFACIKDEFINIDISDTSIFDRTASILSDLTDLAITFLIFKGYSISTIKGLLTRWYSAGYHIPVKKVFNFFSFKKEYFSFYHILGESDEYDDIINLLGNIVGTTISQVQANQISTQFCSKFQLSGNEKVITYDYETIDPHNYVRRCYDELFKNLIIGKERQSLITFNTFIDKSFWSYRGKTRKINKIFLDGDSINVSTRSHTLRTTLIKCIGEQAPIPFSETSQIPITSIEQLNNAIFYYNLALGSKSIENSLSLLWTSLESILPYRVTTSDIECIQHWISKSLSIGAVARDIFGFSVRLMQQNQNNDNSLSGIGTMGFNSPHTRSGIVHWYEWIINPENATNHFTTIKNCSELLAYQYFTIGQRLSNRNLDFLLKRIQSSKESIKFQLQRIYIHRNQIVHSGDLINEYSNLWSHLEWYVGKTLSYFLINIYFNNNYRTIEEAALCLESDYDYLESYCQKNKSKPIREMPNRIVNILFKYNWQHY